MKVLPGLVGLTLFVSVTCCFCSSRSASGQMSAAKPPPPQLEVIVTNGAGTEKRLSSIEGVVPLVLVRANQVVPVTLHFPSDKVGLPVAAVPLDGGAINGERLVVLPTGKVLFTFNPGPQPGRYRLLVQTPLEQHLLEFYVVDPNNPLRRPGTH